MSVAQFADRFWTFSVWSFEILLLPTVLAIFVLALLSLALACWKQRPFQSGPWKRSHWFVLTQLLYFPVVISLGVLYPASGTSFFYHAESTASRACGLLGLLSLVTAAFWVYRMKGLRWFGFSVVAVLQMILMGAFFVAGMAVSGVWL